MIKILGFLTMFFLYNTSTITMEKNLIIIYPMEHLEIQKDHLLGPKMLNFLTDNLLKKRKK